MRERKAPAGWSDTLSAPGSAPFPDMGEQFVLLDDARNGGAALLFRHPRAIIETHRLEEVIPALDRLREGVRQGAYAAGYLAYDAGFALEPRLASLHQGDGNQPLLWFGLFDPPKTVRVPSPQGSGALSFHPSLSQSAYVSDVEHILELIEAGDCYQVNFTFEAELRSDQSPLALYRRLRGLQQAGWGGMLSTGATGLLSCSPELFFALEDGTLRTRPMKGTARRGGTPDHDHANKEALRASLKERAENLMIVDLLRNDMARVAVPGSVQVDDLFVIETYPTIHQMTSSISACLRPGLDAVDVIRNLFPCGSITGAPKIRAMEIIAARENRERGFYTGAMGFIAPDGSSAFNVLIRTLEYRHDSNRLRFDVGSGIVQDSVALAEWAECHAKAAFLEAARVPHVRPDCVE